MMRTRVGGGWRYRVHVAECVVFVLKDHGGRGSNLQHQWIMPAECARGTFIGCQQAVNQPESLAFGRPLRWQGDIARQDPTYRKTVKNVLQPGGHAEDEAQELCECCDNVRIILYSPTAPLQVSNPKRGANWGYAERETDDDEGLTYWEKTHDCNP